MSLLKEPAKTLFHEIDRIEDENAYNVAVLLKTIDNEQKRSEQENLTLNEKVKDLHQSVVSRHSVIVQLQAKLKHSEAKNRLDNTKNKAEITSLNNKLKKLSEEFEAEKGNLQLRIKRLSNDLENVNKDHHNVLLSRNDTDKELRARIQELLLTIGQKDDQINDFSAKVSAGNSSLKAHKARSDRRIEELTERLSSFTASKDEELANLRTKHAIEIDSSRQVILTRDDHIKHLQDKLEKSDERLMDKLNLIKAEYESKLHEVNCLNKEHDREIFRLKHELDEKSKTVYDKTSVITARDRELVILNDTIKDLRNELKEQETKSRIKEESLRNQWNTERAKFENQLATVEKNKMKSLNELSRLENMSDNFTGSLNSHFKNMVALQEKNNVAALEYHDNVKSNFDKLVRTTQDAMSHML